MNLQATIELHCGGPGSGRKKEKEAEDFLKEHGFEKDDRFVNSPFGKAYKHPKFPGKRFHVADEHEALDLVDAMRSGNEIAIQAFIRKEGSQHCVKSEKGKNLGCSPTRQGAEKRLREVEYFKHLKGGGQGSGRKKKGVDLKYDPRQLSIYGPKHTNELEKRERLIKRYMNKNGLTREDATSLAEHDFRREGHY